MIASLLVAAAIQFPSPSWSFGAWTDDGATPPGPGLAAIDDSGMWGARVWRGKLEVFRHKGDGTGELVLTEKDVNSDVAPAFDRQGERIGFFRDNVLWVRSIMPAAEAIPVALKGRHTELGSGCAFSPDGEKAAVVSGYLYHWWIDIVDLQRGEITPTEVKDFDGGFPTIQWMATPT